MNRLCTAALALLTAASLLLPPSGQALPPEPDCEGYLVRLRPPEPGGLRLLTAVPHDEIREGLILVDSPEEAAALARTGQVEYWEPNYRVELLEGDPYAPTQWNMDAVNAGAAWNHTDELGAYDLRGDGVTVAVIDSGVWAEHPDFNQARFLPYYDLGNTGDGVDVWHGTFVAGVIAAQVNNGIGTDGAAPDVSLLPICVTSGGSSSIAKLVQAIDYAVAQGADVINLSIGGSQNTESLRRACQDAIDAGVLVVAAAGNYRPGQSQSSTRHMYPASCDGVVSVSACREQTTAEGKTSAVFDSSYSYFNDRVTVAAPGTAIRSLYVDGGVHTSQGTSFAAPLVSAMAAMAKQCCPDITQESFSRLLCATAADLGEPGRDDRYGHGLVDIAAFADALFRSYSITWELGGSDVQLPPDTVLPEAYTSGSPSLSLPIPSRPGYHFLGWYETPEADGPPVEAIPAGSIGDRSFYARWTDNSRRFFAQYDAEGRMLSVHPVPPGTDSIKAVKVPIRDETALVRLFWLSEDGVPLRVAAQAEIAPPPVQPETGPTT